MILWLIVRLSHLASWLSWRGAGQTRRSPWVLAGWDDFDRRQLVPAWTVTWRKLWGLSVLLLLLGGCVQAYEVVPLFPETCMDRFQDGGAFRAVCR